MENLERETRIWLVLKEKEERERENWRVFQMLLLNFFLFSLFFLFFLFLYTLKKTPPKKTVKFLNEKINKKYFQKKSKLVVE